MEICRTGRVYHGLGKLYLCESERLKDNCSSREDFAKASSGRLWEEVNRYLAQFEDIEGVSYDEDNGRFIIWGPKIKNSDSRLEATPPLLFDDFITALIVLNADKNPGVSISTVSGRVPTEAGYPKSAADEAIIG